MHGSNAEAETRRVSASITGDYRPNENIRLARWFRWCKRGFRDGLRAIEGQARV